MKYYDFENYSYKNSIFITSDEITYYQKCLDTGEKKFVGNITFKSPEKNKIAIVLGGGGFIGNHLVKRLKSKGYWVRAVDIKYPDFEETQADDFLIGDLTNPEIVKKSILEDTDELYQLAADMGGAGYIFTGENDANVMLNSALINLNVSYECIAKKVKKVFYSSSACMYPEHNQLDPENPNCSEHSAYPANPDSEYGWEKLFSERLYLSFHRNYGLNVRIARFHNIFGPYGSYNNGKEKAPAAICRKVAETPNGDSIEIWGDGLQTRSFLYIDECLEAVEKFMNSDFIGPVNIGSEEMVTINQMAEMVINISGKNIKINNIWGEEFEKKYGHKCPQGVRGRKSDNNLFFEKVGWKVSKPLQEGLEKTFEWINKKINK
jgi:GDP-D-mannose 3',5'-epimerase